MLIKHYELKSGNLLLWIKFRERYSRNLVLNMFKNRCCVEEDLAEIHKDYQYRFITLLATYG